MKFDITQLCDVDIEVIDGDRGKNYPHQDELFDSGYCLFLSAKNVTQNGFLFGDNQFITQEKDELLNNGNLIRGDIVITTRGTVGNVAIYSDDVPFDNIRINSGMLIIRCGNNIDNYFLYQVLRSKWFYNQIISIQSGSAQPQLPKSHFLKMTIPMPDMETQRKIAVVLSRLGDKISVNTAINENLEQQAQAIFKSWFVDFEPFGGVMPEDWKITTLGEISEMSAGGDKPRNATEIPTIENTVPIYSNGISNEGLYGFTDKAKVVEESVTVSARGTIGYVCLRQTPYVPIVRLITIVPKTSIISAKYIYLQLKTMNISGTGTTQQQLTVPNFKSTVILTPNIAAINKFTSIVNPMFKKIKDNKIENKKLAELRDTLLPKLMNGEIDVSEVKI